MIDQLLENFSNISVDEMEKMLEKLDDKQLASLAKTIDKEINLNWIPNKGAQTMAFLSEADELYFGGAAGGGKSALLCGLATTSHEKSIIFRREYPQIRGLEDEVVRIIGSRQGYNSQDKVWKLPDNRILEFGAVQHENDVEKFQGRPHDLIGFDELPQFSESQYTFLIGWNRSANGKRCRIVGAGNPPTNPEGFWVIKRWAAWLDRKHPNPAKPGELRWFTTINGEDKEVEGKGPHFIDGKEVYARSRTFIPSKLEDNPYLMGTGYASTLEAMPEPFRTMLREGRFDIEQEDQDFQIIPTKWVQEAMERWKKRPTPPEGVPMCAMGVDIAQGGKDKTVIAGRYDYWFSPLIRIKGEETPLGRDVAGHIIKHRVHGCKVILDMGGGYGGGAYECLVDNIGKSNIITYNAANVGVGRSKDGTLAFSNKRAQAYWQMREALDPSQLGGSPICLPDDPELLADLCAPTYKITPRGIQVESKPDIKQRLGRSTDAGDSIVMCWVEGQRGLTPHRVYSQKMRPMATKAITGRENRRR
jgi:hypothetical protein